MLFLDLYQVETFGLFFELLLFSFEVVDLAI
jgi:hypothetical protein